MFHTRVFQIVIFLFVVACTATVDVDVDVEMSKPSIVLNGFFSVDSILSLELYESNSLNPITDAQVELYRDNQFVEMLTNKGGALYQTENETIQSNKSYSVLVEASNFKNVKAKSNTSSPVFITKVSQSDSVGYTVDNQLPFASIDVSIENSDTIDLYFELYIRRIIDTTKLVIRNKNDYPDFILPKFPKNQFSSSTLMIFSENSAIMEEGFSSEVKINPKQNRIFFSSRNFNGRNQTIKFNYLPYYYMQNPYYAEQRVFIVYLRNISEEYYNYRKSRFVYSQFLNQSDIWHSANSYIQLYSNISNGFGIFAGYSTYIDTLIVEN